MINENALYERIGAQLKAIRTNSSSRQLTQEKLAAIVGLERTSITNIEAGKQRVPLHILYELCNALGVEISEVLPGYSSIADRPQEEMMQIGDKSHNLTRQIADLVRTAS
jgi:transcriptional regulator with XRE-family HTH domain